MNYIDLVIVSVMLFFVVKGLVKGFVREVMGLLSFIVAFVIALSQMKTAANILNSFINNYTISLIVGYIAVFLFVFIILHIIASAIQKLLSIAMLGWLNRLGGAAFGFLFGGMLLSLIVFMFSLIPVGNLPPGKDNSRFYPYLEKFAPKVFGFYSKMIPGSDKIYQEVTSKVLSEQLLKSGVDINNIKGIIEKGKLGDVLKGLDGLKNIEGKKKEMVERLEEQSNDITSKDSPYKELFKHLNIDTTKKQTIQKIMEEHGKALRKK